VRDKEVCSMKTCLRDAAVAVAAASAAVALAACGYTDGGSGGEAEDGLKIGLLLPSSQTSRYEEWDRPLIERRIKELCDDCTVVYANAQLDVARQQQVNSILNRGVEVLILDPVDAT
jgi:D-xylose transport system substrate-binding protein